MNVKSIFFNKKFWKTALPLAIPIALQNLMSASFSMVDTFMVAGLGGDVLSAVGMATQFTWVMNCIVFGLASGTALFISQYWGAGDKKSIHRTEGIAVTVSVVSALLFMLTALFFAEPIIGIFTDTPDLIRYGSDYLKYVCFSYIPIAVFFILCVVLRSTESVKLPVIMSGANALLNIFLNYCLIYGNFGLPKMGASGAALATAISNWVTLIVLFVISAKTKNILVAPIKEFFFNIRNFIEYMRKAFPSMLNEVIWGIGTATVNAILSNMGDDYYTGVTILRTIENIAFVTSVGFCNSCSILVGKAVGAGNLKLAKEQSIRYNCIMPCLSLFTGGLLLILRHPLVSLFTMNGNYSDVAISAAISCITVYAVIFTTRNIPYLMIVGVFRPGGDAKTGLLCDILPLWCLSIPVTAVFAHVLKLPFEWVFFLMYAMEDIPKVTICVVYFLTWKWIRPVTAEGKAALEKLKKEKNTAE